jgi:Putative peptidoglycan binding domain
MRVFLIFFICSIALVSLAPEVHAGKHKDKKSGDSGAAAKSPQKAQAKSANWTKAQGGGKAAGRNDGVGQPVGKPAQWSKQEGAGKTKSVNTWNNPSSVTYSKKEKNWSNANKHNEWNSVNTWNNSNTVKYSKKGKNWSSTEKFTTSPDGQSYHYKSKTKVNTKHFNLSYNPNPTIQTVKFNKNYHINGSQYWKGESYAAFRGYHPEWHDQGWWRNRYNRVVFISGGWYYWNAGWWYPAWGYAPNAYYAYDGPIYGYNGLTPDQVIANVQATLQQQGYYHGDVDGMLGPVTRSALASYQRQHGLYVTSAIDHPTLESLGMT